MTKKTSLVCGSELREKIRKAIIRKCGEDPQDRFRIISKYSEQEKGIYEVQVQWEKNDLEILSVKI